MKINIWVWFILILEVTKVTQSISRKPIVRLYCKKCVPDPEKCCIGSVIYPNYVLTTSVCAVDCVFAVRENTITPVIKTFIHPDFKSYGMQHRSVGRSLALLYIDSKITSGQHYINLSVVDIKPAIGKQALIPIIDSERPRLQVTVIEKCEGRVGYYVCASKRPSQNRACHREQGTPLLLEGELFGITTTTQRHCAVTQTVFIALKTSHYWINSILTDNKNKYKHRIKPALRTPNNNMPKRNLTPQWIIESSLANPGLRESVNENPKYLRSGISNAKQIVDKQLNLTLSSLNNNKDTNHLQTKIYQNLPERKKNPERISINMYNSTNSLTTYLNDKTEIKIYKEKSGAKHNSKLYTKKTNDAAVVLANTNKTVTTKQTQTTTTSIHTTRAQQTTTTKASTKRKQFAAITANLKLLTTPLTTTEITTTSIIEDKNQTSKRTTNAMEWFNKKIRKKLKKGPPQFLVETTTENYYFVNTPEFIDLT